MSRGEYYMNEMYPKEKETPALDRNCASCSHCRTIQAGDSKMRAWFKQTWLRINTINQHGKVYSQPVEKLLNEKFATCIKGYWPANAVCNPQKMGSEKDDGNWFRFQAVDCADYEQS